MFLKPILVVAALMAASLSAHAEGRVALLIGNGNYDSAALNLRNPTNDVALLGQSLEGLGFTVTIATDLDQAGMEAAVATFGTAARGAEMAVFFYAGHGVQIDGANYLIGRNFSGSDAAELTRASLPVNVIRNALTDAEPGVGIIILDACRNNPFVATGAVVQGLARSQGGTGLLIAYATDPGNVAFDGTGNNSVFTEALVNQIGTEGLEARLMFGRVRQEVILSTRGQQVPWVEEATLGEHYFAGQGTPSTGAMANARELQIWREISVRTDILAFQDYLADFPDGMFRQFAEDRIRMLEQARLAGAPSGQSSAQLLASAEPSRVEASLVTLGFMPETRSLSVVGLEDVTAAFDVYRAQLLNPDEASPELLYQDAARMTMFLAATTAQQIRTDIVALGAIDRTLLIARDALAQIEAIALTNDAALPLLEQARIDVAAIVASQDQVLARLDQTRTYYQGLIEDAQENYPDYISPDLLDGRSASRSLVQLQDRITGDARLFVRHVQGMTPENKGTYAWLTDFLPKP